MGRTKKSIAKEYEKLTFAPMKGVQERTVKELQKVLSFEKKIRKRK